MQISEQTLRALVAATDEQHRDGMATMPNDIKALHSETRKFRPSARRAARRGGTAAGFVTIGGQ